MKDNKKQKNTIDMPKEKKVHPFLFLLGIMLLCFLSVYLWLDWVQKSEAKRIKEIVQSDDIAMLLTGKEFSKKEFSKEIEEIKKAHTPKKTMEHTDLSEIVHSLDELSDFNEDTVGLAMKEIQISQGENGLEEWHLQAKWATMYEKTNIVQFENPEMWHRVGEIQGKNKTSQNDIKFLKDDTEKLIVVAQRGLVYDNNEKILLQENVHATQANSFIKGEILSYDNKDQLAVFPNKAIFGSENLEGSANIMSWNMVENKIYGSGQVEVLWTPETTK